MTASLLIIYTGGTIGMKEDPMDGTLKPFDFSQIMEEVPELNKSRSIPIRSTHLSTLPTWNRPCGFPWPN